VEVSTAAAEPIEDAPVAPLAGDPDGSKPEAQPTLLRPTSRRQRILALPSLRACAVCHGKVDGAPEHPSCPGPMWEPGFARHRVRNPAKESHVTEDDGG
jgi:hypothetical protein